MATEARFHPEAQAEYLEALERYAEHSATVASRFAQEVARSVELVLRGPEQWPIHEEAIRWIRLRRFPYLLA